jgi:hypothetical protein
MSRAFFFLRQDVHLTVFALELLGVDLRVRFLRQVAAQAHGDTAGEHLGDAGEEDDEVAGHRAAQAGGEGERHGEPVAHAQDDVAHTHALVRVFFGVQPGAHRPLTLCRR